ncbi:MAG: NUDIX hydrolase [Dethiobacteria bacterium]
MLEEKGLSTTYLYRGRIINLRRDLVLPPGGGEPSFREIVEHPGAVAILALDQRGRVLLVRQYRRAAGRVLLEVPAGKLEPGEEPLACAQRELAEETGCRGGKWRKLTWFYSTPGFCDEKIHLFLAEGVTEGTPAADPGEALEPLWLDLAAAQQAVLKGEINDAKTIIALQFAASLTA